MDQLKQFIHVSFAADVALDSRESLSNNGNLSCSRTSSSRYVIFQEKHKGCEQRS